MAEKEKSSQINRFKEAARELGCDESESAFEEKLKKVVAHKPAPKASTETPKKPQK